MQITRLIAAPGAALLLLHCGGGGGDSKPSIPAPSGLQSVAPFGFNGSNLQWDYPSGVSYEGFEVQASKGAGPFSPVSADLCISKNLAVYYNLGDPEFTPYAFRVRACLGQERSDFSPTLSLNRGLMPVYNPEATLAGGILITWGNESKQAETIALERSSTDAQGIVQPWAMLATVAVPGTSYLDQTIKEGLSFRYRLTDWKGSTASLPQETLQVPVATLPPYNLQATPGLNAVHLTWENRTAQAVPLTVSRSAGTSGTFFKIATLPATATSYDDLGLQTGQYAYRLEMEGVYPPSLSATVTLTTQAPPGGLTVGVQSLALPEANLAFRDHLDRWYVSTWAWGVNVPVNLTRLDSTGGTSHTVAGALGWGEPFVLFDSLHNPHLVCLAHTGPGYTQGDILHDWYDGSAWRSETVANAMVNFDSGGIGLTFALDAKDALHVVWNDTTTSTGFSNKLHYAKKVAGAWSVETGGLLDLPDQFISRGLSLSLDGGGGLHLALEDTALRTIFVLDRTADGIWSKDLLPVDSPLLDDQIPPLFIADDNLTKFLCYTQDPAVSRDAMTQQVMGLSQVAGVWGAPFLLATGMPRGVQLAGNSVRRALAINLESGILWRDQRAAGWGETMVLPYLTTHTPLAFGLDSHGRLYQLIKLPAAYNSPVSYQLIQEGP